MAFAGEQLTKADKLATLGTMVAGVAHDISNPVGLIAMSKSRVELGQSEIREMIFSLLGDSDDEDVQLIRSRFEKSFTQCEEGFVDLALGLERVESISDAIRNQARIDSSTQFVEFEVLVNECLVGVGSRLQCIDVQVSFPNEFRVELFRSQFGQVLMNLVANAADAIYEKIESDECEDNDFMGRIIISGTFDAVSGLYLTVEDIILGSQKFYVVRFSTHS